MRLRGPDIQRNKPYTQQQLLLSKTAKFSLPSGHKENLPLQKELPDYFALFQLNSKLYVCGGEKPLNNSFEFVSLFFSSDAEGKCQELAPLSYCREYVSLTGLSSVLLALGGWCDANLKLCEKYVVTSNKWVPLPPLRVARHMPGSCLLPSKRAFCFCGSQGIGKDQNTIENLETELGKEWKTVALRQRIAKTCDLGAVALKGKILLFGGVGYVWNKMYKLDEEGRLLEDLSGYSKIPGYMCSGVAIVVKGKVYAVGQREFPDEQKWKPEVFDGSNWTLL